MEFNLSKSKFEKINCSILGKFAKIEQIPNSTSVIT